MITRYQDQSPLKTSGVDTRFSDLLAKANADVATKPALPTKTLT